MVVEDIYLNTLFCDRLFNSSGVDLIKGLLRAVASLLFWWTEPLWLINHGTLKHALSEAQLPQSKPFFLSRASTWS